VPVYDEVGKAGAVACVKEPGGCCDIEEDVQCCSGHRTVVRSAYDGLIGSRFSGTVRCRSNRSNLRARRETRLVMILRIIEPGLSPKLTGGLDWVDAGILPPAGFIAYAVHQPMMDTAERHREFVARLAAQSPRLQMA
jgi:hypothetical protein